MGDFGDYDEFGNYIGGFAPSGDASPLPRAPLPRAMDEEPSAADGEPGEVRARAVVQYEDRRLFPDASEVYGADVETVVHTQDAQALSQPVVEPGRARVFADERAAPMAAVYREEYRAALARMPSRVRNVAVLGHAGAGKTALCDHVAFHALADPAARAPMEPRFTDARRDEQRRGMSVKCAPLAAVLADLRGQSQLLHVADCPGHPALEDEAAAAARLCDGALVVVDVLEGVQLGTRRHVALALAAGLPVVLLLAKLDRLVVEARLPPLDAYGKLRNVVAEFNAELARCAPLRPPALRDAPPPCVSPVNGSVVFASGVYDFSFTLLSFAALYAARRGGGGARRARFSPERLAARLWGNFYFDAAGRVFRAGAPPAGVECSFVEFVLLPLYKLMSLAVGGSRADVEGQLREHLGVRLPRGAYELNARPLMREVMRAFFGGAAGLVSAIVQHLPSPADAAAAHVRLHYTGPADGALAAALGRCASELPQPTDAVVYVAKVYESHDATQFFALGRVFGGVLRRGASVRVLGEEYAAGDAEDVADAVVEQLWVPQPRSRQPVDEVPAGGWALIGGVADAIVKTATLVAGPASADEAALYAFQPVRFQCPAVMKVAVEPLHPTELPKLVTGLRRLVQCYPQIQARTEESGERVLLGIGELHLECALRDLREVYGDLEVKVSDPSTSFAESVLEASPFRCTAESLNGANRFDMTAEALPRDLAARLAAGELPPPGPQLVEVLRGEFAWDLLAARSVWAFGPDPVFGPNLLSNDTLSSEVPPASLRAVRAAVEQGFRWGVRNGPLCDEPVRGVHVRLLGAELADDAVRRSNAQVVPAVRRATHAAILSAAPRMLEPVLEVHVLALDAVSAPIEAVLARRRGFVVGRRAVTATPLEVVVAHVPMIESFGMETDLRSTTLGSAFPVAVFDHWDVVPGDPLDRTITLRPLEPVPRPHLAREFMVKTRRRKGLAEDVSLASFFTADQQQQLVRG